MKNHSHVINVISKKKEENPETLGIKLKCTYVLIVKKEKCSTNPDSIALKKGYGV